MKGGSDGAMNTGMSLYYKQVTPKGVKRNIQNELLAPAEHPVYRKGDEKLMAPSEPPSPRLFFEPKCAELF